MIKDHLSFFLCLILMYGLAVAEEPPLPAGLGAEPTPKSEEPSLPQGLGGDKEPALPEGLNKMDSISPDVEDPKSHEQFSLPFNLSGFIESRGGVRLPDQDFEKRASIGEGRLQIQAETFWKKFHIRVTSDFVADPVADRWSVYLDTGDGFIDLREAFISIRATEFMDIKAGRQILTWGTGDLVFLNDLFPKDFDSFLIGRDEDYLKAPSDALKVSLFSAIANADIVYTPNFDPDRYADGARVSTFDPFTGGHTSRDNVLQVNTRDEWFTEDEWAVRLYRNLGVYEMALYGYDGYWKNPQGIDIEAGRATFPKLSVYGGSIRGPVMSGIGNIETAYYDSREDRDGSNPFIANDQLRILIGFEREILPEFTGGFQYYLEHTLDYSDLKQNAPPGTPIPDENRHVLTVRLTKLMMNQNLTLSVFNFWAPGDHDGYIRPKANYKIDDHWTAEAGANIFYGKDDFTFFGQFEDNTNVYISLRYGF